MCCYSHDARPQGFAAYANLPANLPPVRPASACWTALLLYATDSGNPLEGSAPVPVTAALYRLCRRQINHCEQEQHMPDGFL